MTNINPIELKKTIQKVKTKDSETVHGVQWAEIFITVDGKSVARYQSGRHVKLTSRPDYIVQFGQFDRYQVDLKTLRLFRGARIEVEKALGVFQGDQNKKCFAYKES